MVSILVSVFITLVMKNNYIVIDFIETPIYKKKKRKLCVKI